MNKRRGVGKRTEERLAEEATTRQRDAQFIERVTKDWTIGSILEQLGITLELRFVRLLELCHHVKGKFSVLDDLAQAIYDSEKLENWKDEDFLLARAENRLPSLEEIIDWKGLSRVEIAGSLAAAGFVHGMNEAKSILASRLPEIMQSAISLATEGEGNIAHLSQKLLFEASGLTKSAAGTVINVQQNNTTQVAVGLPKWDEEDKVVGRVYFDKVAQKAIMPVPERGSDNAVVVDAVVEEVEYVPSRS